MAKIEAKPGDFVEVDFVKNTYQGVFLEAPKDEKGIILLKLNSGYNIGLNKKDILDMRILKKVEEKESNIEIKKDKSKPNIAMIVTGGTISSELDSKTGAVKWLTSPEKLFKFYPEIFEKVNVVKIETPFMKGSENMDFHDWQKIAKKAEELLNNPEIKGLIITHGTDTLHYTSAALSFFLRNLGKPVVLTYSQRSTDRASSDASLNLEAAAVAAISDIAEVVLVGHASTNDDFCYALRGTKVRKLHSSKRDAFKPVNAMPLARITRNAFVPLSEYRKRTNEKTKLDTKFEEKVALIKFYPGQNPDILDYYAKKGYKGIVIEMLGLGHVATGESRNSWISKLKEIQKKGIVICAAAQTIYGRLDPLVYSTGRELIDSGVIYLEDMLSETALIKLGWVLGHEEWAKSKEKVKEMMLTNVSGEFSDRLEE
ncbi:MAG: Glu-tRNA(Gln) amidotransferase subunit GatD [Candidatus Pacearchaeota archaeon]|jgi:glutamyl-tRNA(Gln) amidotransferase subunit D